MSLIISEDSIDALPIAVNSQVLSGTPVFEGTRVPIENLFDNLAAGICLDEFFKNFPTVTLDQVLAVLNFSNETLKEAAGSKQ